MTKLKVKLLREGATMPSYAHPGDSGLDVRLCMAEEAQNGGVLRIAPLETVKLYTGLAFDIPGGFELQVRPRSGLSSKSLLVHFGTVDGSYRGEVAVTATSLKPYGYIELYHGDRIAQLVLAPVVRAELEQTDELSETERGAAGFGSTGVR